MPRLSPTDTERLPWGSHLCNFYKSTTELQRLLTAYIHTGLADHEGCLWVLPPSLNVTAATLFLQQTIPQVHDYLRTGQLELVSSYDWYRPDAPLDAERILARCRQKMTQVAAHFVGLRVTGDCSWVQSDEQRAQFIAYEHGVNEATRSANILALCTYPAAAWSSRDMFKVFECHCSVLLSTKHGWQTVETC